MQDKKIRNLAEEIIEADDFNAQSLNQGKYSDPSKNATYTVNDAIKINRRTFEEYDEKYQWPLAFGLLLLVIEILARDHRRKPGNRSRKDA